MIYSVEMREQRVAVGENGETGSPTYLLEGRFSTVELAEVAGNLELERLRNSEFRYTFGVLDGHGKGVSRSADYK